MPEGYSHQLRRCRLAFSRTEGHDDGRKDGAEGKSVERQHIQHQGPAVLVNPDDCLATAGAKFQVVCI